MGATVVLLRGVNVGGGNKIKMADLRAALAERGLSEAKTLLQSGNIVCDYTGDAGALVALVEKTIREAFGLDVAAFTRSGAAFRSLVQSHPFDGVQLAEPKFLRLVLLSGAPDAVTFNTFVGGWDGPEQLWLSGDALYAYYPNGMGRSKLDLKKLERALGLTGTARNWNTVQKLVALSTEMAG